MRLKTLLVCALFLVCGCAGDESHFLNCGQGEHLEAGKHSYCLYTEDIITTLGDDFICPEGSTARIPIAEAVVCTNVPNVNTIGELPQEVCEQLNTTGCATTGSSFSQGTLNVTLSSPSVWLEDETTYPVFPVWFRDNPDPDTVYLYGEGTFQQGELSLELPNPLPQETLESGLVSLTPLYIMDPSYDIPAAGAFNASEEDEMAFESALRGVSPYHAIFFKQDPDDYSDYTRQLIEDNKEQFDQLQLDSFDNGWNCVRCVPRENAKDWWEPVACDEIVIEEVVGDLADIEYCDWE